MGIITIDLGTTNIKVAAYTNALQPVGLHSHNALYERHGDCVEFDADTYVETIIRLVSSCRAEALHERIGNEPIQLVLTGQAESLVVVGQDGRVLRKGISWLDMRSRKECVELAAHFDTDTCYQITGQPEIIPTWPLTKILWLHRNEPECFAKVGKFLMIKDYVLYRLTGRFVGEHSIYPFSHYFDITQKQYWVEPLDYCGVSLSQLPELVPPCSVIGKLLPEILAATGLPPDSIANAGALDHFCGMIGTGNIVEGMVSESAGTVSSIATFAPEPFSASTRIPLYCGPFANSYIYLPVCESGGISLEWFRNQFMSDISFSDLDRACTERAHDSRLIFLPYLTGVNPPEFDANATGVFYGVQIGHDKVDFSLAIMIGIACLLRKNIDFFKNTGIKVGRILSTGGGAKSALWSQIKADICNLPVAVPRNNEAPSLGAAIIGAVNEGFFPDYSTAISSAVHLEKIYTPSEQRDRFEDKYEKFCALYSALSPVFQAV